MPFLFLQVNFYTNKNFLNRRTLKSFKSQLEKIKDMHKGNKTPSVHVLGDFHFGDIVWPARLHKSGSPLSPSEGGKFMEILNHLDLEH